ncbi:hypothetical protein GCM10023156_04100 [Novipirellula rosea]|uniref:Response regulatory domain-containing protein n=1 Tax=Novipirellula rosea TaxID=1031540 RepID=A0ABP8M7Z2_9BACT
MLGADVFVVKPLCFLISQLHDFSGAVGKAFVHIYYLVYPGCQTGDTFRNKSDKQTVRHFYT